LTDFYGTDNIPFSFTSDEFNGVTKDQNGVTRPVVTRSYTSFSQAAEENGQSRIYLGIHWSFDKVQGILAGGEGADYIFPRFLRPVSGQAAVRQQRDVTAFAAGAARLGGSVGSSATVQPPAAALSLDLGFLGLLGSADSSRTARPPANPAADNTVRS